MVPACLIPAANAAQWLSFKANFSVGHDDTKASMTASLDDVPLACDEGSKTELMGEDGDVSLECRFPVAARPWGGQRLSVKVSWRHAQYTGFQVVPGGR